MVVSSSVFISMIPVFIALVFTFFVFSIPRLLAGASALSTLGSKSVFLVLTFIKLGCRLSLLTAPAILHKHYKSDIDPIQALSQYQLLLSSY